MEAERWKRIDELLDAAHELPAAEREDFVAEACGADDELRREVLSLLEAEGRAANFIERPAMSVAARSLAREPAPGANGGALAGRRLGAYQVERPLGAGGMGEVYLARDERLERRVALKILPAYFVADPERVARFEREARAVSALNHPNILTVYEVGREDGLHFIATEYVEGRTLRELVGARPRLKELLSVVSQAAEALSAAHAAGVVHRDVKPENVMVRADGYVKVLDFGLAKLLETAGGAEATGAARTQAGTVMGTLAYMSPEQATGDTLDQRTDIWSLGVVLYELATGVKPFAGAGRLATVKAILDEEPLPPTELDSSLPAELDRIIGKALEKDRELRYQTASDLRADLKRLRREIDSSPSSSGGRGLSSGGRRAARRLVGRTRVSARLALAAAASVVVLGLVGWLYVSRFRGGGGDAAPDWSRAQNVQLTEQAGTEFHPSLAPDGRSFVYAGEAEGNFDIYVQRVGGKNPTNLTRDSAADDTQPAFSPDGERIAFRSEREPPGIYLMGATGENVRRLSETGHHPAWSPDGKEVAFSDAGHDLPTTRNTRPSALRVVNVETGAKRLLTDRDAMQPAWSPHGQRVAFWFMPPNSGRRDVATVPAAGGEAVVVTRDATTNWNPVWSPDGRFLYYASDRGGQMNFWRVRVDEQTGEVLSEPEAVVTPSKFSRHLGFSRDGRRMVYVQTVNQSNIQAVEFDPKNERTVGEPFWVTRGDREVVRPELSPDGRQFVMRLPRRTQDDVVLVNREGTSWRDLTDDKFFDRYPRFSPDGRRVAFTSDRGGRYEIWTIDTDGTNLRQITFDTRGDTTFPVWSPDGRLLYRDDKANFILDPKRGWREQTPQPLPPLASDADVFVVWDWSPDGDKLSGAYLHGGRRGLGYFSFKTGRYEFLGEFDGYPMWMSDSRRLVFGHEGKVFVIDTATKRVREVLSRRGEQVRSVDVSADGRLLYYTVPSSESDIWLLDLD